MDYTQYVFQLVMYGIFLFCAAEVVYIFYLLEDIKRNIRRIDATLERVVQKPQD